MVALLEICERERNCIRVQASELRAESYSHRDVCGEPARGVNAFLNFERNVPLESVSAE